MAGRLCRSRRERNYSAFCTVTVVFWVQFFGSSRATSRSHEPDPRSRHCTLVWTLDRHTRPSYDISLGGAADSAPLPEERPTLPPVEKDMGGWPGASGCYSREHRWVFPYPRTQLQAARCIRAMCRCHRTTRSYVPRVAGTASSCECITAPRRSSLRTEVTCSRVGPVAEPEAAPRLAARSSYELLFSAQSQSRVRYALG